MPSQYHDLSLAKYAEDSKRLQERGFTEVAGDQTGILGQWQGTVTVELGEDRKPLEVTFQIAFPDGYPWHKPHCIPIEPAYNRCQHQQPNDVSVPAWPNRLCIWEDNAGGWDPSFGVPKIVEKVREWVKATELGWHTRGAEEATVFDPARYFGGTFGPIYFPNGLGSLNPTLGTVDMRDCAHGMVVTAVDGIQCPSTITIGEVLGMVSSKKPTTIPYLVCSQPSFPLFADLSGLLQELVRQGFERKRVIQHLGHMIPSRLNHGMLVMVYEALDTHVGCGLRYQLPTTVRGYRPGHAPGELRIARAGGSRFDSSRIVCLDSETLLRRNPVRMRNDGLRNTKIAMFGLGSIGSQIADLLAKGGVDELLLIDADVIQAGNVIRHTVGLDCLGQSKALAVKEKLQRSRIDGSFEVPACASNGSCSVEKCIDDLSSTLQDYNVLVDCTANETVQDYLMREAIRTGTYYCRVQSYQGGSIGEVIIAGPNGPCATCIEHRAETNHMYAMSGLDEQETTISEGCANVTQPAFAADLVVTCGIAVEGVVDLLLERSLPWNLRYWVARPIPGATEDSIFARGPQVYDAQIDTEGPCPICRT